MIDESKTIFITHPYYAVNNPTNNFRIYKKLKNSDHWTVVHCKNKDSYRKKIKDYIIGFYEYSRDAEKSHTSIREYAKDDNSSLFDYFMGGKKSEDIMNESQMKREEMAILKNGEFLLDKDVPAMQKRWCNYIEDSNIQLAVLSFYQSYVDENISVKELQKKIATDVIPKFLSYCGYENPKENLEWIVALHSDRENNYHFHIAWIEKNKCYRNRYNKLEHKVKLTLSDNEINFLKRQASLTIERKKLYTPAIIQLENDFSELKKYFNPKDQNFTLRNVNNLELEEKIIKLGFLINQIRSTNKKYIKYNSLPKNDIGKEIRKLTIEIKKELFKDVNLKKNKDNIYNSIDKINDILIDIDKRNNISEVGFENAMDNKMIKDKLEKSDNYILNAIVNHALYNFDNIKRKIKKNNFKLEDVINQIAFEEYNKNFKVNNINTIKKFKIHIINKCLANKRYTDKFTNALNRLSREQDKIAEEFYKMLEDNNEKEYKSR